MRAQLAVAPTYGGNHPHYDRILRHIGAGLDDAVRNDPWCQEHGITEGRQYLQVWCALLFREPKQHLPMLYLFSQARDNGKSVLHKGLGLMFKAGYVEGTKALNEKFNKLLAGAVLVYLDEEKVSSEAGEKVKKYIEADNIILRLMRTDGFMYPNFSLLGCRLQLCQRCSGRGRRRTYHNDRSPDVIRRGQVGLEVDDAAGVMAERTDFLGTLMTTELPPSGGRLYLPVLSTALKEDLSCRASRASRAAI